MVKFGAMDGDQQPDQGDDFISDVDDADFLDPQPGQGDDDFMSDDDDYPPGQGDDDDDFMSQSDDDEDDLDDEHPHQDEDLDDEQPDQGDLFTVHLTGAIRRETRHGSTQQSDGASSEHYDVVIILPGGESYTPDHADEDDEEEEPAHAPPAAALEAAEAPADDCCPVCLQQDGEAPAAAEARPWRRVAPCGHRFHAACVEKWLRVKLSCPVCRCPAAGAGCCPDAAPEPPRPIPDIVEEFLAMGYDESLLFEKSPRWMEFTADPDGHVTSNSSRVSSLDVAA